MSRHMTDYYRSIGRLPPSTFWSRLLVPLRRLFQRATFRWRYGSLTRSRIRASVDIPRNK